MSAGAWLRLALLLVGVLVALQVAAVDVPRLLVPVLVLVAGGCVARLVWFYTGH